ncbi:MAG: hypothetical protein F8N37_00110 [Telmatospirillum sp.]|nr:hypothetical protein [Telmatospirillum sp.]
MNEREESVIRRAYAEASLAAREKGLSGITATRAVLAAAAKVSTRILGRTIAPEDVQRAMQ